VNFQKHAATRTATNSRVAPTPPWYHAAMMRPPQGGSVGFYDDPDEDTIEMVLSPEDMRKLARAAEEPAVAPKSASPAEARAVSPALQDQAPKAPRALPDVQTAPPGAHSSSPDVPRAPDAAQAAPPAAVAPVPAAPNSAPAASSTKAQAEHLLHTPHEAGQTKLPTPPSLSGPPHAEPAVAADTSQVPQTAAAVSPPIHRAERSEPARQPQGVSPEGRHPIEAHKSAATHAVPTPAGPTSATAKSGSPRNRRPAMLAGGALAAVAAALLILSNTGSWSPPAPQSREPQQAEPAATPRPQPPEPSLAAPQAPAAVAPPAAEPLQPADPQPATTPVRFKNPFDRSEIFQFPAGTSLEDARQSVADLLIQRARDRHHPGVAQRRAVNGVTPGRPARDVNLAQNSARRR